jgi:hypothetical protein
MDSRFILPFILRFLPAILIFALAFVAASDKKTRQQWANLLYQAGSVRPDQRDDPKVQNSVKWPFIVLAIGLLFLPNKLGPVSYYRWVTNRPTEVLDVSKGKGIIEEEERIKGEDPPANAASGTGPEGSVTPAPGAATPLPIAPPPPPPGSNPSGGANPGRKPSGIGALR